VAQWSNGVHDKRRAHSTPWRLLGRQVLSPKKANFGEVICSDENSRAIYYTETYDENVMSVVYSEYGLVSEGMKPQIQATNEVKPLS